MAIIISLLFLFGSLAHANPETAVGGEANFDAYLRKRDAVQKCLEDARAEAYKRELEKTKGVDNCKPKPGEKKAPPVYTFQQLNGELPANCLEGDLKALKRAFELQIGKCDGEKRDLLLGDRKVSKKEWCLDTNQKMLDIVKTSKDIQDFYRQIKDQFIWYKSSGALEDGKNGVILKGEVQFTGYDTPVIQARRTKGEGFTYPIYARPKDLVELEKVDTCKGKIQKDCGKDPLRGYALRWCQKMPNGTLRPYPIRQEIDSGNKILQGKGLEIAWVKDPLWAYDAMLQGSVVLEFEEGAQKNKKFVQLNNHGQNGRINYLLGKTLRCFGAPEQALVSMPAMRKYIEENNLGQLEVLSYDQSYVFFRERDSEPKGAVGVPVTGGVSLATDPRVIPLGAVTWIDVRPRIEGNEAKCPKGSRSTIGIAQDTGGAIVGAHVDQYFGRRNGELSKGGNDPGSLFIAIPKRK